MQDLLVRGQMLSHFPSSLSYYYLISLYSFDPLISSPTYILSTSLNCSDLIFTDQCNFVIVSRVHPFLHIRFEYQVKYCNLDFSLTCWIPYLLWTFSLGLWKSQCKHQKSSTEPNWLPIFVLPQVLGSL